VEAVTESLVHALLGRIITGVKRLHVVGVTDDLLLQDALLIQLDDGSTIELLNSQEKCSLYDVSNGQLHVSFTLYEGESVVPADVAVSRELPIPVAGVTTYSSCYEKEFLLAFTVWMPGRIPAICIGLETDDIELLEHVNLVNLLFYRPDEYGCIVQRWHAL
jgi:hypothetical protein